VTPKVGEDREGWPASHVYGGPAVQVPYQDPGLSGYLRHYLEVGDLPIIVSHSFAALMLFVHLHTV
jgi:hypothetical protein